MATDEKLLADFLAGSEPAFTELVARYQRELFVFLHRFVNNGSAAEDLFQETFVQVYRSAARFDPDRRFRAWLFTIASNKARDYLRANRRRETQSLDNLLGSDTQGGTFLDLFEVNGNAAHEDLIKSEDAAAVRDLVAKLPNIYREVLLLSYFNRFSYKQVAEMLNVPVGTVKSRLHSALGQFGRLWKQRQLNEQAL